MNVHVNKFETPERQSMLRVAVNMGVKDYEDLCRAAKRANMSVSQFARETLRQHVRTAA